MAREGSFQLQNDTKAEMVFQIEPECWTFKLDVGESVTVNYDYEDEPATIQLTDPVHGNIAGAIIPGDGDVVVLKNGKNVLEELA